MYVTPQREEIKRRRLEAGLSMHSLSVKAGLSSAAILRIENGIHEKASDLRVREIARVLNCRLEDICTIPGQEG